MKKILQFLLLLMIPVVCLADYPAAKNEYVNDFANVINDVDTNTLKKQLKKLEYESGIEVSVVTINSYGKYKTGTSSWEEFSTGLFNQWGVGNLPENNGVLFLISKNDRKIRIELGAGYPSHYNNIMKTILDKDVAPLLKHGAYGSGIQSGVNNIVAATTVEVSFFEWYKWYIIAGIVAFISLIISFFVDKENNPHIFWMLLASVGLLLMFIIRGLWEGRGSMGSFGGGNSAGGGASGSF